MSKLSEDVRALIVQAYPHYKLWTEHYVNYKGTKLFFDFFLPELGIAFEAQGKQHDTYVDHFHGSAFNYQMYRKRDRMKKEWAAESKIVLIEIRDEDLPDSVSEFLSLVNQECDLQGEF